ncbi:TetR/AcrR family transcriptional regulator [Mycolicibacterium iranicum]|uniref:Helix-turn-helix domain containing protein n=1 Tax=Mycolicibacterium iranicum TaxID=912594 RepID=A0A1X1WKK1_MYCIR|nr:TetR/AcrR family transcriptional regulator [Mycolicibacterium iranicum]MCZ0730422.1 helix-turn-helix domain containing protein [Mycolicibacterium iranicum]ORV87125.1 TetR family transcriptional regulator [Mycolicibacterium iranicum]
MTTSAKVIYLRSYGDRDRDDHDVVRTVLDATVELLRDVPFDDLTTRLIAEKAGVAHGDLCVYFRSKDAIVAEVYLGLLRDAPLSVDVEKSAQARVAVLFRQLVTLLADQPGLAAACASAMISHETSVQAIRKRIHAELHRRVRTMLGSAAWPEVAETLEFGLVGAMVQASSGSATFEDAADDLARMVAALLPENTDPDF